MAGSYMNFSPSARLSPQLPGMRAASSLPFPFEQDKYLSELLAERQKLAPFMEVLPNCSRLLNQEIGRVSAMVGNTSFSDPGVMQRVNSLASGGLLSNGTRMDMNGWAALQSERLGFSQASSMGWYGAPEVADPVVKKSVRMEVPVDKFPNFNFVGRLLGPRGNSLKRVESLTNCRILIRGRGSIRDHNQEEERRGKPGHEHLDEPLHVIIEAEARASIIDLQIRQAREILEDLLKPLDENEDFIKKQQLRELAMINGTLREDSRFFGQAASPFDSAGMKRPKTKQ